MLNNSLFYYFMLDHGLEVYKGESTRQIICLSFEYGSRSYDTEYKRLKKLLKKADSDDLRERLENALKRVEANKDKYAPLSRDEIREYFYEHGVNVTYTTKAKDGSIKSKETIHYKMLTRSSGKAKLGMCLFIDSRLYDVAHDWLTMGIKLPDKGAKIVEMSAYMPLTTSTIIGKIHIDVDDFLLLKDQDSLFRTMADIVREKEYGDPDENGIRKMMCVVDYEETDVKNTLWDGMGLVESSILPSYVNGMVLLRNHFFKMCGFRTHIQKFFKDWCDKTGNDYNTYQVEDMFGNKKYLKNVKVITTNNALKIFKFKDLMGDDPYEYWCEHVRADGCMWGVVKTDHKSKLGEYQQLSYQMVNSLPTTKDEVREIASESIKYVELLKSDPDEYEKFLRKNANEVNHYEMMADLYRQNHEFANSRWFRLEKRKVISSYVHKLRTGKIFVNGDNLTVCGNPYALLLYSVGDDFLKDPTLQFENGTIQCFTPRFRDGEYLIGFRSPQNNPGNIAYLHNRHSPEMFKYFEFSKNIVAVNCIKTDIQPRLNGMDFDSDFMLVSNNPTLVKCAKRCYDNYPTAVNALEESGITYDNTPAAYAMMDNKLSHSRLGIGWSSNLAQLAMTYYWTEMAKEKPDEKLLKEYKDIFVILAVGAQVEIDSAKRVYTVSTLEEIKRIGALPCMTKTIQVTTKGGEVKTIKQDFPFFMRYTRPIPYTKDGKDLPEDEIKGNKNKLNSRINPDLVCPMNWLQEWLDKIQGASSTNTIPTEEFFIKFKGKAKATQMTKIYNAVENYSNYVKSLNCMGLTSSEYSEQIYFKEQELFGIVGAMKIGNIVTINRLVELSLGIPLERNDIRYSQKYKKYSRKILSILYKTNKEKFLSCFTKDVP